MSLRFGTDGVRGVANTELTPTYALALGSAVVDAFDADEVVIGVDTRQSGAMLAAAEAKMVLVIDGFIVTSALLVAARIAPEILDSKTGHSYEVDFWAIGVILYTLVCGRPPFESSEVKQTYKKIRACSF